MDTSKVTLASEWLFGDDIEGSVIFYVALTLLIVIGARVAESAFGRLLEATKRMRVHPFFSSVLLTL